MPNWMFNWMFAAGAIIAVLLISIYMYRYVKRSLDFWKVNTSKRLVKIITIIASLITAVSSLVIFSWEGILSLHIVFSAVFVDLLYLIIRPFIKNKSNKASNGILKCYRSGVIPLVITTIFMVCGMANMNHVVQTNYNIKTDKNIKDYKIALITDVHYGTIQNKKLLEESVKRLNTQIIDFAVLGGDLVDEHTSKSDMQQLFKNLGGIKTKYGIYYIYGNHDTQPYTSNKKFTVDELNSAIKQNNIKILQDTTANINDDITLVGRSDASWGKRISTDKILENSDKNNYIIVADHHPLDMDANSGQGADLQLSGHTHGGQIWPVGNILEMVNKPNYGEYEFGNMKLIVSSGHTGWGFPIRTQKLCEYVIIDLQGKSNEGISYNPFCLQFINEYGIII